MKDSELYEELGLNKNEGKCYETLVRFGKLGAGEISNKSGVPYGRIYNILDSLIHKGLINSVPEKTKKFVPASPENFIELIEKKQKVLENAKIKARTMKQLYEVKEKNPVVMVEGRKAFYKIVDEMKESQKYDYAIKWTSEYRPDWLKKAKKYIRQEKEIKVLTRYDKETEKDVKSWLKVYKSIRKIDNEGIAMSISDDKEVMISLINNNVTLLIRDKAFAKIMKKLFLAYYEDAEKIK
ncbi:MAG: helix-turn-helix domain-containing protein [archaeon]